MCYKDEVQKKNAEKLQRKFEEDNVPKFIRDYFSFMNSEAGKLNYWGTIKNFLMWCIERNDIRKDNIEKIKKKKDDFVRERNLVIVRVLKGTGLRESELAGLDLQDLYLEDSRPYITVMGKGVYYTQDAESVLVSKDAKLAFEEWLKIRSEVENIIDDKAVFINKNGKRLSEDNIQAIFRNYSGGKITPHMMRHLYATVLYQESGHDAAFVQEQLRHSDVNTTLGTYAAGDSRSYEVLENM